MQVSLILGDKLKARYLRLLQNQPLWIASYVILFACVAVHF